MDRVRSPRARAGFFSRLVHAVAKAAKRLKPKHGDNAYRPEKHYMRGPGPKSKRASATDGDRTPNSP